MDIGGICCILTDTAGLRSSEEAALAGVHLSPVEMEGIKRAKMALQTADLLLFVCDVTDEASKIAMESMVESELKWQTKNSNISSKIMVIYNKIDKDNNLNIIGGKSEIYLGGKPLVCLRVSTQTEDGIQCLEAGIQEKVISLLDPPGGDIQGVVTTTKDRMIGISRQRHRYHLQQCIRHLKQFLGDSRDDSNNFCEYALAMDARAEELRY